MRTYQWVAACINNDTDNNEQVRNNKNQQLIVFLFRLKPVSNVARLARAYENLACVFFVLLYSLVNRDFIRVEISALKFSSFAQKCATQIFFEGGSKGRILHRITPIYIKCKHIMYQVFINYIAVLRPQPSPCAYFTSPVRMIWYRGGAGKIRLIPGVYITPSEKILVVEILLREFESGQVRLLARDTCSRLQ